MIWWQRFSWFITTGFFTSYLGFGLAPGTFGSLAAMFMLIAIHYYVGLTSQFLFYFIILSFFLGMLCIPAGEYYLVKRRGGGKKYGKLGLVEHDLGTTVVDEFLGMGIGAIAVWVLQRWGLIWLFSFDDYLIVYLIVFIAFRFFDITKIFGVACLEEALQRIAEDEECDSVEVAGKLNSDYNFWHSLAIMLDDALAGFYAALVSFSVIWLVYMALHK